jgi:hypothetical protein
MVLHQTENVCVFRGITSAKKTTQQAVSVTAHRLLIRKCKAMIFNRVSADRI